MKFATYAVYWIEHFVRREIESRARTVAVPLNVQYYLQCAARAKEAERHSGSQVTDLKRTAQSLGISKRRLHALHFAALQAVPLETLTDEEKPIPRSLQILLTDGTGEFKSPHDDLQKLLAVLPPRERFLIEHRHGLIPGQGPKILEEVAKLMGISRERVRQMEMRALKRMRAASGLTTVKWESSQIRRTLAKAKVQ